MHIPCSFVAHLEAPNQRNYRANTDYEMQKRINYKRLVEVWFDDYKDIFYFYNPDIKVRKSQKVSH